jgi:1-acyl-sn-glycerol-3-phosphate acyltransferase
MANERRVIGFGSTSPLAQGIVAHAQRGAGAPLAVVVLDGTSHRLDEAVRDELDAAHQAVAWARQQQGSVVLVSRLSAIGGRRGLISDDDPRQSPFGNSAVQGHAIDLAAQHQQLLTRVATARDNNRYADAVALRHHNLQQRMRQQAGPSRGHGFAAALQQQLDDDDARSMRAALRAAAADWRFGGEASDAPRGFISALAELIVAHAEDVARVIVRAPPALSGDEHSPLWRFWKARQHGQVRFPLEPDMRLEWSPLSVLIARLSEVANTPVDGLRMAHLSRTNDVMRAGRFFDVWHLSHREASSSTSLVQLTQQAFGTDAAAPSSVLGGMLHRVMDAGMSVLAGQIGDAHVSPLRLASSSLLSPDHGLRVPAGAMAGDVRFSQRGWRRLLGDGADDTPLAWTDVLRSEGASFAARAAQPQPAAPNPRYDSLVQLLHEATERYGNKIALSRFLTAADAEAVGAASVDWSYREVLARAQAVALRLQQAGVVTGSRIILAGLNDPAWGVVAFGAMMAGATLVPLDPNLDVEGCENIVRSARPLLAIVDHHVRERLSAVLPDRILDLQLTATTGPGVPLRIEDEPSSDDIASILYTSGTTGEPKGVMLSHGNFCALVSSLSAIFPMGQDDRLLSVLPLHHTFEFMCGLMMPLAAGAQIYTPDALVGDRVLYALKQGRITSLVGVPALWQLLERRIQSQAKQRGELAHTAFEALLSFNHALGKRTGLSVGRQLLKPVHDELGGHLRTLISGGSALPPAAHELFQGLGLPLAEGYGLTEAAPVLTVAAGVIGAPAGTVGRAVPGVELKLHEPDEHGVGEVWARAGNVMQGYFENPVATALVLQDGWLKTGDLGRFDNNGRLVLVGRSKDVVISAAGENIYLDDVERRLENIAGITELTLVGLADPRGGERLALAAVLVDGTDASAARQALQSRIQKLAAFQRPVITEFVSGPLPRTATRKVKRREVKKTLDALVVVRAREAAEQVVDTVVVLSPLRSLVALVAGVDDKRLTSQTHLVQELGFDSLMWVELQGQLERSTGKQLDAQQMISHDTIAALEAYVAAAGRGDGAPAVPADRVTMAAGDDVDGPTTMMAMAQARATKIARGVVAVGAQQVAVPLGRALLSRAQRDGFGAYFTITISGEQHIPHNRPTIVVANHSSHLDVALVKYALGGYGERLRSLAAKDYFFEGNAAKVAFFEHLTNLVPIDRETGSGLAFEQAREVVMRGDTVLIFPEGTRREDGTLGSFKPLVAKLALATGVDVLPLHLRGCFDLFPRGARTPKRGPLHASIGPPLPATWLAAQTQHLGPVQAARAATEIIHRAVMGLRDGTLVDPSHRDAQPPASMERA